MRNLLLSVFLFFCVSHIAYSQHFEFFIETTTQNETFTIPIDGSLTYNYNVDVVVPFNPNATVSYTNVTGALTHTFGNAGSYIIRILDGSLFPRIIFSNSPDKSKITIISKWGNNPWTTMESAFEGCDNLILDTSDTPNLTNVTSTNKMFKDADALVDNRNKIGSWDMSNVENMSQMFRNCDVFNEDLSNWDTSNVETFTRMFQDASAFDQNLGNWDISNLNSGGTDAIFAQAGVSTSNYDQTVTGWGTLDTGETQIPSGLNIRFDNSTYCASQAIRTTLANAPTNWNFIDSGLNCNNVSDDGLFITTWETTTANESITIPTAGPGYGYYIDWGDGQIDNSVTGNISHTYASAGTHRVRIGGLFPRIYFNETGDRLKIKTIEQWGTIAWRDMFNAFDGCENLTYNATDAPNLSNVTDLSRMFNKCKNFNATNLNNWDLSSIRSVTFMFNEAEKFNGDISNWDVSNVIDFRNMFSSARDFNRDISGWTINTNEPVNMGGMFAGASDFNQPIGNWNISQVTDIGFIFQDALNFNQSLANWDISNVTDMDGMLNNSDLSLENYDATLIGWATLENGETQIPTGITFSAFGLSFCQAYNERSMLENAPYNWIITDAGPECSDVAFITTWQTTSANESIEIPTDGNGYNYVVNWGDGTFDTNITGNATHTYATAGTHTVEIFGDFPRIYFNNSGDKDKIKSIDQWGTIQWVSMAASFRGASNLRLLATDVPDLSGVTSTGSMFAGCTSLESPDLSHWDMSAIRIMNLMFFGATNFNGDVTGWDVGNCTGFAWFFREANAFNQDISNWNIGENVGSNDIFMDGMFESASNFNRNLASWNISNVVDMTNMLDNSGLSVDNYDATLIGWATLDAGETQIPSNINVGEVGLQYCASVVERTSLKNSNNWSFLDATLACPEEDKFIMVWKTTSNNESIRFQFTGATGNNNSYTVDWGDGTVDNDVSGNRQHTYAQAGTYEVKLSGEFRFRYNNLSAATSTRLKLYEIKQWGANQWTSTAQAFYGCENLKITATDVPDLSLVSNMEDMFRNCNALKDLGGKMGSWDVSNVDNFSSMFQGANNFDTHLGNWNLSNAMDMSNMLNGSGLSSGSYDLTLVGWRNNPNTPSNINLGASGLTYCNAVSEHDYLDNDLNWSLNDAGLNCPTDEPFITKWETTTANETITIPIETNILNPIIYNYYVDWGDGSPITFETGEATHAYVTAGIYDVKITGEFPQIRFENSTTSNRNKILSIEQWGTIQWRNFSRAFRGCSNIVINATDIPDLSSVTSLLYMFEGTSSLVDNGGRINDWDTSTITQTGYMFQNSSFNEDINNWDVSNVTFMGFMFRNNTNFNQPLNDWELSENVSLFEMFKNATAFNQDLASWDISGVNSMGGMLDNTAMSMENYDNTLIGWATLDAGETQIPADINLGAVGLTYCNSETERGLLTGTTYNWIITDAGKDCDAISFITTWETTTANETITIPTFSGDPYDYTVEWGDNTADTSETGDATHTYTTPGIHTIKIRGTFPRIFFDDAAADKNKILTIEQWGPNQWTTMSRAFMGCTNLVLNADDSPDLSRGGTSTIRLQQMFTNASNLVDLKDQIGNWDVSNVVNMWATFGNCTLFNEDISGWNVSGATSLLQMFVNNPNFNQDLSGWNTSNVQNFSAMFAGAAVFNQNISGWNTSNATNMNAMFIDAASFNQDISGWDVSSVQRMDKMFQNATAFNQNISGWNVSSVQRMDRMFQNATAFNQDLSNWDISSLGSSVTFTESAEFMFFDATAFSTENYDALLLGWSTDSSGNATDGDDDIPSDIVFEGPPTTYCPGAAGIEILTDMPYNWTINGGTEDCESVSFITTWQVGANETIVIPTFPGATYDYRVDWGDGTVDTNQTGDATHTYTNADVYTVSISGTFPRIYFNNDLLVDNVTPRPNGSKDKLLTIEQWGPNQWTIMHRAFQGCSNLVLNADDTPDFSGVTTMGIHQMFQGATNFEDLKNQIGNWNVSNVVNMYATFGGCEVFNEDISGWNVANVSNFLQTFVGALRFNQNISGWNTSSAITMSTMFANTEDFNQDISGWNVSSVEQMQYMFANTTAFNQDISTWDVSAVQRMNNMFQNAAAFNQDLSNWDISSLGTSVTFTETAENMFQNATAFTSENYDALLIGWATDSSGNATDGDDDIPSDIIFAAAPEYCLGLSARNILTSTAYNWAITDGGQNCDFTNAFITTWETTTANENITIPTTGSGYNYVVDWGDGIIESGFTGSATHVYTTAGIYTVSVIGDFPRIYFNGTGDKDKIKSIEQWGAQEWTSMKEAFRGCEFMAINATDSPNLSQATDLSRMFVICKQIETADLSNWDTSTITNMSAMFNLSRFNGNISTWDVGNVTNFKGMFKSATRFNQDISQWNIGEFVTGFIDMSEMFQSALNFNQSLNTWDVSKADRMHFMFDRALRYNQPMNNWDVSNVIFMNEMFDGARNFNQDLSSWDISTVDTFVNFLTGSAMSQQNYDNTLIGWATIDAGETGLQTNVRFDADATYCLAFDARETLTSAPYNWDITDGGQSCGIFLAAKVYLQGAALNPNMGEENLMRDDLRIASLIPTTSPYGDGLTCDTSVFNTTGANAIVDWIWIELRDKNDNTSVLHSQSALLQRDGDIVATDGVSVLSFNAGTDNYFIAVKHRNHLGIMTSTALLINTTSADFSNASSQITFGNNAQTTSGMPSGVVAMWSGNTNNDAVVQYSGTTPDTPSVLSEILNDPGNFLNFPTYAVSGYNVNDINMNGSTQYSGTSPDTPLILQNVLAHPGNFLNFSTYQITEQLPEN
ncbi:BspA family leucine-rich repeat surface protein [uncultured Kordia sp.]|uniref:BspA family leucine-rich repeat surface protein n=1 Tax=uncultured Kordia sp. TaxID=507699 RepID=UPI00261C6EC7|nr:BspA family leucine-rich repeat surface protein [uncultured Kordia sp.]